MYSHVQRLKGHAVMRFHMRPEIPEDVVYATDQYVKSQYGIDPDALSFAAKVRILLSDTGFDMNQQTAAGLDTINAASAGERQ